MGDEAPKRLRRDSNPNFSCSINPDDRKIIQLKREDLGITYEVFFHYIAGILKPVKTIDDLVDLKRLAQQELRRNDGRKS